jgi:hypothetical protein
MLSFIFLMEDFLGKEASSLDSKSKFDGLFFFLKLKKIDRNSYNN